MPTRRAALEALAGATAVGSLSGCVRLATRRTVEFHATPATVEAGSGGILGDLQPFSKAVSVEARQTVERLGVTREVVAHSWGVLYAPFAGVADTGDVRQAVAELHDRGMVVTLTTPSIELAGQEQNPVGGLTVREFAEELTRFPQDIAAKTGGKYTDVNGVRVDDATGQEVLRAFRNQVGGDGDGTVQPANSTTSTFDPVVPDWTGDSYSAPTNYRNGDAVAGIQFQKHGGDFVVLFRVGPGDADEPVSDVGVQRRGSAGVVHPDEADFDREALRRHLAETDLRGAQGLVEEGRNHVEETLELLAGLENETRDEGGRRFEVVSETRDDLNRLDTVLGGLGEHLGTAIREDPDEDGIYSAESVERVDTEATRAVEIAARALERVASHNDTRNRTDDRLLDVEGNLREIEEVCGRVASFANRVSVSLEPGA